MTPAGLFYLYGIIYIIETIVFIFSKEEPRDYLDVSDGITYMRKHKAEFIMTAMSFSWLVAGLFSGQKALFFGLIAIVVINFIVSAFFDRRHHKKNNVISGIISIYFTAILILNHFQIK